MGILELLVKEHLTKNPKRKEKTHHRNDATRRNHSNRNHSHSFKADHKKEVVQQEVEELLMLVEVPVEVVIQLEMHNGTL